MKTTIFLLLGAALLSASCQMHAEIIAGPITDPANGHDYYLLAQDTWAQCEAEAEKLGGTLAIIKNADEQNWTFSNFGNYGGTSRVYWIGYRRQWQDGPFAWTTDEKADYVNWNAGEPNNAGGHENCVEVWGNDHGVWNDTVETLPRYGLVEVPGKSQEKSLTGRETSLVGLWYNNGDSDQPCNIAATDRLIFAIDQNNDAGRVIYTPDGLLFSAKWKQHAVIAGDKILWSRGNWWSREPVAFKTNNIKSGNLAVIPD